MLAEQGDRASALNAFETAVALNPRFMPAAVSRCFALGDSGQVEEGFRQFHAIASSISDDFKTVFPLDTFACASGGRKPACISCCVPKR
jgi:hypothetical protein